jgi:hypothetical protein
MVLAAFCCIDCFRAQGTCHTQSSVATLRYCMVTIPEAGDKPGRMSAEWETWFVHGDIVAQLKQRYNMRAVLD